MRFNAYKLLEPLRYKRSALGEKGFVTLGLEQGAIGRNALHVER